MSRLMERVATTRDDLLGFISAQGEICLLYDPVGNVGDLLIKEGTKHMLEAGGIAFQTVASDEDVDDAGDKTLLVRGSGGWSRLFHGFMPGVVRRAAQSFRRVVILPSSFDPSVPEVAECLQLPNVTAIARERRSERAIAAFPGAFASIDCAFYHERFWTTSPATEPEERTLVVLREDKGSLLPEHGLMPDPIVNDDISLSTSTLDDWLGAIERSHTVVTDRLHVAVAAALLDKELIVVDPYEEKVSTYFEYALSGAAAETVEWRPVSWLSSEGLATPIA